MHYLIQSNIRSDDDHHRLIETLDELGLSYETIVLKQNTTEITTETNRTDVFVYGSVKLARLWKANTHWTPGSFYGGNHRFEIHSAHYKEHLLNYHTQVFELAQSIDWKEGEQKFIKPYVDAKIFTGQVFTETKWKDFVAQSIAAPKTPMLKPSSLVQASTPQSIIKEARLWIVGGQVVAGAYYRFHGDVPFEQEVSVDGLEFAKSMLALYQVADAFVMDICLTYEGWKIVEVNCINSAGFYPHLKIKTLIRALEAYFN